METKGRPNFSGWFLGSQLFFRVHRETVVKLNLKMCIFLIFWSASSHPGTFVRQTIFIRVLRISLWLLSDVLQAYSSFLTLSDIIVKTLQHSWKFLSAWFVYQSICLTVSSSDYSNTCPFSTTWKYTWIGTESIYGTEVYHRMISVEGGVYIIYHCLQRRSREFKYIMVYWR